MPDVVKGYLDKFGATFLVAALIPSMTFTAVSIISFTPILPPVFVFWLKERIEIFGPFWMAYLFVSVIIGFVLASLNTFIHKVFEGYIFFHHFPFFEKSQRKKYNRIQRKQRKVERRLERYRRYYEDPQPSKVGARRKQRYEHLYKMKFDFQSRLEMEFPPYSAILPTQYGNALRSAELYSFRRFNLDALMLWPHLLAVIPNEYMNYLDETNRELSFLLYASVLSIAYSITCFIASTLQFVILIVQKYTVYSLYGQRVILYLVAGVSALVLAYLSHRGAVLKVYEYGGLIRAAVNLNKFKLLAKLNQKLPDDSIEESKIWRDISLFFLLGEDDGEPINLQYHYRAKEE